MRVELIYTPGCSSYKKALNTLETAIAEERLPIPVEVVESSRADSLHVASHTIRIDGHDLCELPVRPQGEFCRLYNTRQGLSGVPCIEIIREILWKKWKELTEAPLSCH